MNVNELTHPHGLCVILLSLQFFYIEHVSPANMVVYRVKCTVIWCLHCCVGENLCQLVIKLHSGSQRTGMLTGCPISCAPPCSVLEASSFLRDSPGPVHCFLGCRGTCHCDTNRTKTACLILTWGWVQALVAPSTRPQLERRDPVGGAGPGAAGTGRSAALPALHSAHATAGLYSCSWKRLVA